MKRDYFLGNFTLEGCAAVPDFYVDPATSELRLERRTLRGRAFRADYRHLQKWFLILVAALLIVSFGARWGYERKAAEVERLQPLALPSPTVERPCAQHAEIPNWDTLITESCHWTVTRL